MIEWNESHSLRLVFGEKGIKGVFLFVLYNTLHQQNKKHHNACNFYTIRIVRLQLEILT